MQRRHEMHPSGREPDWPHPLAIPEILCMLSEYFDQQTLLAVLKVSRAWRTAFSPYFWKHVQVDMTIPERRPPFSVVQQNSDIIHSLQLRCKDTVALARYFGPLPCASYFPTCSKLSKLTIQKMGHGDDKSLAMLIRHHSKLLTSVSLTATVDPLESSSHLLEALASCTNLRQLEYRGLKLTESTEWMTLYQTLWSHLDVLVLTGDWYYPETLEDPLLIAQAEETEIVLQNMIAPSRIQDLTIVGTKWELPEALAQRWVIEQSSATLTRLRWSFESWIQELEPLSTMAFVYEMTDRGLCPKLETLLMPGTYFSLDVFTGLIRGMARLTEVDLSDSNFGNQGWWALQLQPRHLSTIRVLHLEHCRELGGLSIQEMLCSMVSLVSFKAGSLYDLNVIEDPRPWVCRDLKELVLTIVFTNSHQPQQMIHSRLASLVKLEVCQLNRPSDESFRMTLQSGLDRLKKLRWMKRFHVQTCENAPWAMWKEDEIKWVLKHWPFLEELSGVILSAPAGQLLCRHGVRYTPTQFIS